MIEEIIKVVFLGNNSEIDGLRNPDDCCEAILIHPLSSFFEIVANHDRFAEITPKNIPQFSNIHHGSFKVTELISQLCGEKLNYLTLGRMLLDKGKKEGAYIKYGENHVKLAHQLGLVNLDGGLFKPTAIGLSALKFEQNKFNHLIGKLALRIPVMSELFKRLKNGPIEVSKFLQNFLSEKTAIRRSSNLKTLGNIIAQCSKQSDFQMMASLMR